MPSSRKCAKSLSFNFSLYVKEWFCTFFWGCIRCFYEIIAIVSRLQASQACPSKLKPTKANSLLVCKVCLSAFREGCRAMPTMISICFLTTWCLKCSRFTRQLCFYNIKNKINLIQLIIDRLSKRLCSKNITDKKNPDEQMFRCFHHWFIKWSA